MGTIQTFPTLASLKPAITAAKADLKALKKVHEEQLKRQQEAIQAAELEVAKLRDFAEHFVWLHNGSVWPIERRECDDGMIALVLEVRGGWYCACCDHGFGTVPSELQKFGVDKVIVRHPQDKDGRFPRTTKVCEHYHLGGERIIYPEGWNRGMHGCDQCKDMKLQSLFNTHTLPEFPGLLEWEFYNPEESP